ncbi:arsenate reductase ArsC [Salinibacterium sp. SWN139]|uniref:arsenate reductase ArsC n=1 Tax=Salinibacterium sp. SWN139 TaxID=2792055 RepID=UPI0018CFA0E4|nr:arsenate reductase ArsC [Salinibacterium sp. SWN139]MBH0055026.1 arsenate reductase ArsC [Salinibacterium sp. SWN139]
MRTPPSGQLPLTDPNDVLRRGAERLAVQYDGLVSEETIERVLFESYAALARTAKVSTHLASLSYRFAHDRLAALAQAKGVIPKTVPEVLFVCVQNSGRSQMAAAWLRELGKGRVHVRSAGSEPGASILSLVVDAMAEEGIALTDDFPKPLTDDVVRAADAVITMGCGDACPIYPGKRYLDWQLTDPADLDLDGVRRVRDEIRARVEELLREIAP